MSKHLIQTVKETEETLLKQLARNHAIYTDAHDNFDGFPANHCGSEDTEIGTVYYKLDLRTDPFSEEEKQLPLDQKTMNRQELAAWLHDEYEEIAVDVGWETQDGTSVPFDELPDENQEVMLRLADRILDRFPGIEREAEDGEVS